jgi:hypothetical protein
MSWSKGVRYLRNLIARIENLDMALPPAFLAKAEPSLLLLAAWNSFITDT